MSYEKTGAEACRVDAMSQTEHHAEIAFLLEQLDALRGAILFALDEDRTWAEVKTILVAALARSKHVS